MLSDRKIRTVTLGLLASTLRFEVWICNPRYNIRMVCGLQRYTRNSAWWGFLFKQIKEDVDIGEKNIRTFGIHKIFSF